MDTTVLILLGAIALVSIALFLLRRPALQVPGSSVSKDLYNTILAQNEMLRAGIDEKEHLLRESHAQLAARDQTIHHLREQLQSQQEEKIGRAHV